MSVESLAGRLGRLHTALLCDVLDGLGFRDSALGMDIRPMEPGQRLAGPAFTMRCEPMERPAAVPYQHLLAAFRDITPGSVVVMRCGDQVSAMWGELLSAAARVRGATGAVMDGAVRDVEQILEMGFPVFPGASRLWIPPGARRWWSTAARCGAVRPPSTRGTGSWATLWGPSSSRPRW